MAELKLPKVDKGNSKDETWKGGRQAYAEYCTYCKYLVCQCERLFNRQPLVDTRPIAEVAASKTALKNTLAAKFVKHHVGMPNDEDLIDGHNYVVGSDGIYLIINNKIGKFVTKTDKVPFVNSNPTEGFQMKLENRIPHEFLLQTIAFFKKVMKDKGNAEAMVQVFQKTDGEYFLHVADQEVSGAQVKFKRDAELEKANLLILDVHSHNTMGAFFSGTDNADEKEARMYGVIGQLNKEWPAMLFRAGNGTGGWIDLEMYMVYETPEIGTEVPDEWMSKVHKPGKFFKSHAEVGPQWPLGRAVPSSPYQRRVFGDDRPWGSKPRPVSFGPAGSVNQDIPGDYDWDRWAFESGYEDEDFVSAHPDDFSGSDVGTGINALVEAMEVLPEEDAKGIALALCEKLDYRAKDILHEILASK